MDKNDSSTRSITTLANKISKYVINIIQDCIELKRKLTLQNSYDLTKTIKNISLPDNAKSVSCSKFVS